MAVLANDGNGTLLAPSSYPSGKFAYGVTIVDLNNDGKNDLVVPNGGDANISVFLNAATAPSCPRSFPVGMYPDGDRRRRLQRRRQARPGGRERRRHGQRVDEHVVAVTD